MKQYKDLLHKIMDEGEDFPDRTGTGTRSIFGHQMRFDLQQGFPVVTLKKSFWRGALVEMLWMMRGLTNTEFLEDNGVHFWRHWADQDGYLGPVYGAQMRDFNGIDQLSNLLESLCRNPQSRRHIINLWNPRDLPAEHLSPNQQPALGLMALPPCHMMTQWYVTADNRLSCQLYQRSADVPVGVPLNIAEYAFMTHVIAKFCNMDVGELVWTGGDVHVYQNQFDVVQEMLDREPKGLSHLVLNYEDDRLPWDIDPREVWVENYDSHPFIKTEVSV